jgi:ABC-type glycerol-3-phosphate transport system substrate-binding protein
MKWQWGTTLLVVSPLCTLLTTCGPRQTVITILGENSGNLQSMQAISASSETSLGIKLEFKPNTFEDAFAKGKSDLENKTGLYDILLLYNLSLSDFVRHKYVYTLDELRPFLPPSASEFEGNLFPDAWHEIGWYYKNPSQPPENTDSICVGYPFAANTMILVFNKDLFNDSVYQKEYRAKYKEKLDTPKTWDQFKRIAEYFTKIEKGTYGLCMTGADSGWLYYEYCNILYGKGGAVYQKKFGWQLDSNAELELKTPNSIKATKFFDSLKYCVPPDPMHITADSQVSKMKQGNIAMAIMWSDYLYSFTYGKTDSPDKRFGFAPVPGLVSPLAGGIFYINRQSEHAQEAAKYIMTILAQDNQVKLIKAGLCSPLRSAYDDPEVKKLPYVNALRASLERGIYMFEAGPDAELTQNILTKYLYGCMWLNRFNVEDALDSARVEILLERPKSYQSQQ